MTMGINNEYDTIRTQSKTFVQKLRHQLGSAIMLNKYLFLSMYENKSQLIYNAKRKVGNLLKPC